MNQTAIHKYIKKCKLTRRALAQFTYCTGQRQDKIVLLTGIFLGTVCLYVENLHCQTLVF